MKTTYIFIRLCFHEIFWKMYSYDYKKLMISENATKLFTKSWNSFPVFSQDSCKKIMVKVAKSEGIFRLVSFLKWINQNILKFQFFPLFDKRTLSKCGKILVAKFVESLLVHIFRDLMNTKVHSESNQHFSAFDSEI